MSTAGHGRRDFPWWPDVAAFSLIDCISVGVDRMQRTFEPLRKLVKTWQMSELTDVTAKVVIYEAFVEGRLRSAKASRTHCA